MTNGTEPKIIIRQSLERIAPKLPGAIRHRMENALASFSRAANLFAVDREMASFRAITGEEEAATALMKAIELRGYEHARDFKPYNHTHKVAVSACVTAVANTMLPMLRQFQLIFDFEKPRIDVKVPLSAFGVSGGEDFAIQPVEPLNLIYSRDGIPEHQLYADALGTLAEQSSFENIKRMVADEANARNKLLYASDAGSPVSEATLTSLAVREARAQTLLVLCVMVLQTREHLPMVRQAVLAFLSVISRLPTLP